MDAWWMLGPGWCMDNKRRAPVTVAMSGSSDGGSLARWHCLGRPAAVIAL